MIDLTDLACPVCGRTGESELVHNTSYPEHRYPGTFTLRRCGGCGLVFNSPRLDDGELARLYGRNYYFFLRGDAREFERIVSMYPRTFAMIDSDIPVKRSIDIGCGRGYFPAVLRCLEWDASGIEISPDAAEYARTRFALDVFTGTVEQYASSSAARRFPLVTAIDVIEHVPSPNAFVAAAARIVEPGGRLIIDTPNAAAHNIALKGVAWKGFNPFHVYLFNIENLTTLLGRHGMTVEKSFSYGNAPQRLQMRDGLVAALKATGLLRPAVGAYFALKKRMMKRGDPDVLVGRAVRRIRSGASYLDTADASAPLSSDKTGDNIVVVARKQEL
jgi:2-polyprenyl-3-methyl-5-hydroxy-6-metoxy-1,4-benzoquinol methylase